MRFRISRAIGLALIILGFLSHAHAAVDVDRMSSPTIHVASSAGFVGMYAAYQITNNSSSDITDLWVGTENFSGSIISTGSGEDGFVSLGPLAVGQTTTAFIYLQASAVTSGETHDVTVYNGIPSTLGGTGTQLLATPVTLGGSGDGSGVQNGFAVQFLLDSIDTAGNNASTVDSIVVSPGAPALGSTLSVTVTGSTGSAGGAFAATPAVLSDWPADSLQLVSTSIEMSGGNTLSASDTLYLSGLNSVDSSYTSTFRFLVAGPNTASSAIVPVNYHSNLGILQHTGNIDANSYPPIQPVENFVSIATTVDPAILDSGGGTTTYTVQLSNTGGADVELRSILENLPRPVTGFITYVSNSATFNGISYPDSKLTRSSRLHDWAGPFLVPASTTASFTYDVSYSTIPDGPYDNRSLARIGLTQIDTTTDTSDDAAAVATLVVGTPPIDTDGDGVLDLLDEDDDNDGIPDVDETGLDTDFDGMNDSLDIDSDNDGIVDNIEAQTFSNYVAPTGIDTDGDGLDDAYDPDDGGSVLIIVNSDGLDQADFRDTDSDNDGVSDQIEAYDLNADGIPDVLPAPANADEDGDGVSD
ncbi:hypothetical protein ACUNV4_26960 [Granulosicoccus sp. 3-233]|uniref:hypothetical protein n=1 Tax=Granulosicoccus sp. 3-233 TaxID=3417969 RepID=UPI003D34E0CF